MSYVTGNTRDYRIGVQSLNFGKRVGPFIYIHVDGINELNGPVQALVSYATGLAAKEQFEFNVIKAGVRQVSLSLLQYPGFWRQAFPILAHSAKLDLGKHVLEITDYTARKNRPVLHRKELLLPPGHGHIEKFSALTAQAEEFGLFNDAKSIGLERGWRRVLKNADVKIVGHKLVSHAQRGPASIDSEDVSRHKTAMRRERLSQPLQAIQRFGYLDGENSVFDYGCGRGDDLEALQQLNVRASGWDPHYNPDDAKIRTDIVNLGFVINVIENRAERDAAVRAAFALAKKFVVVSALIGSPAYSGRTQEMGDGVVTTIGTFQKYYLPDELENYVRGLLNVPVMSIAQGTVLAFAGEKEADKFRARRAGSRRIGQRGSLQRAANLFLLDEEARSVLSGFWSRALDLGREPLSSELSEIESVESLSLSTSTAFKYLSDKLGTADIEVAADERTQDMLVQFALGLFDGRVYYKYLTEDVQRDIGEFFGGFNRLQSRAKELLFSISDTSLLRKACEEAAREGFGYQLTSDSLQLHVSLIDRLAPVLRVYVGCALRLAGGIGRASLAKIHIESGKVSLMTYDDFDGQAVPYLVERIKVNLWARRTEYFDYIAGFAPPPLLMKSLFIPEEYEYFNEQAEFDGRLMKAGLFDIASPHPSRREFEGVLDAKNLYIQGYELISRRQ